MSRYLTPGLLARNVLNPVSMRLGIASTLTVKTRITGKLQTLPVNVLVRDGKHYLVSVRGESSWVRNLRVAGECSVVRKGEVTHYVAEELPLEERPAIIAAYRKRWEAQVRTFFRALPNHADHAVFLLRRRAE